MMDASGENQPVDRDFVLLPRTPLLEFLGEMALPPWTDENGQTIGSRVDAAPIAARIVGWLDQHDLGDLYAAHIGRTEGSDGR